jgi:hypothetical protein
MLDRPTLREDRMADRGYSMDKDDYSKRLRRIRGRSGASSG